MNRQIFVKTTHRFGLAALCVVLSACISPKEKKDLLDANAVYDEDGLLVSTLGSSLSAPGSLQAIALSSSQVELNWNDRSSNESGFKIKRATSADGDYSTVAQVPANTISFTDSGLSPSSRYYYKIKAFNSSKSSNYAAPVSVMTLAQGVQPPVLDTTAPSLSVSQPLNGAILSNASLTVSGSASDASGIQKVTVNGVLASGTTSFSAPVTLNPGLNTLIVIATDDSSNHNSTTQNINVTYNPPVASFTVDAGPNQTVYVGSVAVFQGSSSLASLSPFSRLHDRSHGVH